MVITNLNVENLIFFDWIIFGTIGLLMFVNPGMTALMRLFRHRLALFFLSLLLPQVAFTKDTSLYINALGMNL